MFVCWLFLHFMCSSSRQLDHCQGEQCHAYSSASRSTVIPCRTFRYVYAQLERDGKWIMPMLESWLRAPNCLCAHNAIFKVVPLNNTKPLKSRSFQIRFFYIQRFISFWVHRCTFWHNVVTCKLFKYLKFYLSLPRNGVGRYACVNVILSCWRWTFSSWFLYIL